MSFPRALQWPGGARPSGPFGQPDAPGPGVRPTLRRWAALLALAGLAVPGASGLPGGGPAAKAMTLVPDPAPLEALPLGDPWEAVVVEPAPPGVMPEPWEASLVDADGTPLPVPPPEPPATSEETPRALPAAGTAAKPTLVVPKSREYLRRVLVRYAQENGLPADLVMALAWKESSWRAGAVSKAGAVGVMQLMPDTVEYTSRRLLGLNHRLDPRDPVANVRMGTRFLRHLVDRYDGNYRRALTAYNQGVTSLVTRGAYPGAQRFADAVLALRPQFQQP